MRRLVDSHMGLKMVIFINQRIDVAVDWITVPASDCWGGPEPAWLATNGTLRIIRSKAVKQTAYLFYHIPGAFAEPR